MGADIRIQLCTWVDAIYVIHPELNKPTVIRMLFVYEMVHCKSRKQKMNTKIYTKSELVGRSDYLLHNICIFFFMEAQVYAIKQKILFQYNQNEINIKNNKKNS